MPYAVHGYTMTSVRSGDGPVRSAFRFDCTKCSQEIIIPAGRLTAEGAANKAKQAGWRAHHIRKSEAVCPACQLPQRSLADVFREHLNPTNNGATAMPEPTPAKAVPGRLSLPALKALPSLAPEMPLGMKHLTSEQRLMARGLLDQHFDDKVGCYLESYSDERVAAEVGVALALIRTMREAAYGPIRVSADVLALRTDMGLLQAAIADQRAALSGLEAKLTGLQDRLAKLVPAAS